MSSNGCKLVFLVHPQNANNNDNLWQNHVVKSVAKLLLYLGGQPSSDLKLNLTNSTLVSSNIGLKWGYKYANNCEIKFHSLHEFLDVSWSNLELFQNEMKIRSNDVHEEIDYSAHTLATTLMAMMHDFQWERLEISSPTKPSKKRKSFIDLIDFENNHKCLHDKIKGNFVFVVGPLPKSQKQLNQYFEWQINTEDDIAKVLMPEHLAQHFQSKHNIRFFWLDTTYNQLNEESDCHGFELINSFLRKHGGFVIPASAILRNKSQQKQSYGNVEKKKIVHSYSTSKNCSVLSPTNCSLGSDAVFEENVNFFCDPFHLSAHLPVSSILDYYFQKSDLSNKISKSISANLEFGSVINDAVKTSVALEMQALNFHTVSSLHLHNNLDLENTKDNFNDDNTKRKKFFIDILSSDVNDMGNFVEKVSKHGVNHSKLMENNTPCNLLAIGLVPITAVSVSSLSGASFLCSPKHDIVEFKKLMTQLSENKQVLLIEKKLDISLNHVPSVLEGTSLVTQVGILQPLLDTCCTLTLLSEHHKKEVSLLLQSCDVEIQSCPDDIKLFVNKSLVNFTEQHCNNSIMSEPLRLLSSCCSKAFDPSMLESWYSSSECNKTIEMDIKNPKSSNSDDIEFKDHILSELKHLYTTGSLTSAIEKSESLQCKISTCSTWSSEFSTWNDIVAFVSDEKKKCLEASVDQLKFIKAGASNIVDAITFFLSHQDDITDHVTEVQSRLNELVLISAVAMRGREYSPSQKYKECVFQILLRMEWLVCKDCINFDDDSDDVAQFLRFISLASNVDRMKEFLCDSLVEFYGEKVGDFLVEIHNCLMIPVPESLRMYLSEEEIDESCARSSVRSDHPPSTGPFSLLSSVGSMDSSTLIPCNRSKRLRKGAVQLKPIESRQIQVPKQSGKNKYETRNKSISNDAVNRLLPCMDDTSSKPTGKATGQDFSSPAHTRTVKDATDEMVMKVRRDLFASPSKPRKKLHSQPARRKSTERKPSTKHRRTQSVIDTPVAKQRLTALARQRLRLRRSCNSEGGDDTMDATVIQESPLKPMENRLLESSTSQVRIKRSPRHSIMLTRRHSFYRDGSYEKCRTVARAKVVQQHKEAVPPTPQPSSLASAHNPLFSPKSLLFSYAGSKNKTKPTDDVTQGRSRRRLQLVSVDDSLTAAASDDCAPNDAPESSEKQVPDSKSLDLKEAGKCRHVENLSSDDKSPPSVEPFQSYRAESTKTSSSADASSNSNQFPTIETPKPPPLKRMKKIRLDDHTPPCKSETISSPPQLRRANQIEVRRSPRLVQSPTTNRVGPLDQYVIRTPTTGKQVKQARTPAAPTPARKLSPIGDHIQKWPRKKRISGTSPRNSAKRRKRCSADKTTVNLLSQNLAITDDLNSPTADSVSPGIEFGQISKTLIPKRNKRTMRRADSSTEESIEDMGVFPLTENLSTFRRWTSPRRKPRSGTLYHAPVASEQSFVPLMLLHDDSD